MSVYSDLLEHALQVETATQSPSEPSLGELAAVLIARRSQLEASGADITAHIAHDVALLRLCGAIGIDGDPAMFDVPTEGRQLLHTRLCVHGFDVERLQVAGASSERP